MANQEQSSSDMQKLNNQLISAVQKNVELGEQLEEWQVCERFCFSQSEL